MHIVFASYAHKGTHEKIVSELNNWRYDFKGKERIAKAAPIVSEIKFYDVRIPKECAPEFMRDMGFRFNGTPIKLGKQQKTVVLRAGYFFIKMFRKMIGLTELKPASGERQYRLHTSWCNNFLIGVMKDDHRKDELTGEVKELL